MYETTVPTTIYASRVIDCSEEAWKSVRFPSESRSPRPT